jgi:spermidine synthase
VSRRRALAAPEHVTDFGTVAIVPDRDRPESFTLLVDGVAQSHVDLADPTRLDFEYMRRLATIVDTAAPAGEPLSVLHLGGGALSMARYVAATRPGSRQRVVERDAALTALVRRELPLPRGADIRVTTGDARAVVDSTREARYDLVIADVYSAAQMPRSVASTEFAAQVARILRPHGRFAANIADLPPLAFTRTQVATLATAFAHVYVLADPGMLRGRRYGNVVLAAGHSELPLQALTRAAARDVFPGRVLAGADLDKFVAGARPVDDAKATESPLPPPNALIPKER